MTKEYSITFVGFVKNTPAGCTIVERLREFVKGTGFGIRLHGRNPNRKQFYSQRPGNRRVCTGVEESTGKAWRYTPKHSFQQDLPLKNAKTFAVYLRPHGDVSNFEDFVNDSPGDYQTKLTKDGRKAKKLVDAARAKFLLVG